MATRVAMEPAAVATAATKLKTRATVISGVAASYLTQAKEQLSQIKGEAATAYLAKQERWTESVKAAGQLLTSLADQVDASRQAFADHDQATAQSLA